MGGGVSVTSKYEPTIHKRGPAQNYEVDSRQHLTVDDVRDFTARFCGDPIPGDKRRELFPGKNYAGTDRWWDK